MFETIRSRIRVGILVGGLPSLALSSYTITDLGTLGGEASAAYRINNLGQVVGWSTTAGGELRAFLYSGGSMQDLGTLTGGTLSFARGIDDLGRVVGHTSINAYGPAFEDILQGFIWENGSMSSIGWLYCECDFNTRYGTGTAYAINGAGQVVGWSRTQRGIRHAILWQSGVMEDIGGGYFSLSVSVAYGINAIGQVVGQIDSQPFLWQAGAMQNLPLLPGYYTMGLAQDINDLGEAVGRASRPIGQSAQGNLDGAAPWRAVLWRAGSMTDLGTLAGDYASEASSINELSQVVGRSHSLDGKASRAFLWQNDAMHDLNALIPAGSGWGLTAALSINDAGQIAGVGVHGGKSRAYVLTPDSPITQSASAAAPAAQMPAVSSAAGGVRAGRRSRQGSAP